MVEPVHLRGVKFLPVGIDDALNTIAEYIPKRKGDYFCFANIHVVMECYKNAHFRKILNQSAANFADGMGTAGALKILGYRFKNRVRGTDFMLKLCDFASKENLKIFLYGNTEATLNVLEKRLSELFPSLNIVDSISPPFRELTKEEDRIIVNRINKSDPDILFVSLGAPKQEKWMAAHKGHVKAIQLGVGAAFDFIVGDVNQSPVWMQKTYLEWLYRLPQQPKKTIIRMSLLPEFLLLLLKQFISERILGLNQKRNYK
jgi:N-acetylglucosaminyldiphosphoundecaprenol N-acetyl-beta-D-mannosaminyltransferase